MSDNKADNYFAIIPHWVLFSGISSTAIQLYCVLRTYADNRTMESWPSRQKLADDLNVQSVRTVDAAIKELLGIGALKVEKRFNGNQQTSNLYILMSQGGAENCTVGVQKTAPRGSKKLHPNYNQLTKTNGNKPDGLQVRDLMQIYFENLTEGLEPSRGQVAGQLQSALKQIPYEQLKLLVVQVALAGQPVTRNTLIYAQNMLKLKQLPPTPTRPKFDPAEFDNPDGKPMPENFREMFLKGIQKPSSGDLSEEQG